MKIKFDDYIKEQKDNSLINEIKDYLISEDRCYDYLS